MSYINSPGLTSAAKKMITRQQVSDVITFTQIITTAAAAKRSQVKLEKLITIAKKDNLISRRRVASTLMKNQKFTQAELTKHFFEKVVPKYINRPGGYTRLLRMSSRTGDNAPRYLLQLV